MRGKAHNSMTNKRISYIPTHLTQANILELSHLHGLDILRICREQVLPTSLTHTKGRHVSVMPTG